MPVGPQGVDRADIDVHHHVACLQFPVTEHSATNGDYIVPRTHRKLNDRAFLVAAPKAWNQLPTNLKSSTCSTGSFKRSLKTFLFQSAYGCETCASVMRHRSDCRGRNRNNLYLYFILKDICLYKKLELIMALNSLSVLNLPFNSNQPSNAPITWAWLLAHINRVFHVI